MVDEIYQQLKEAGKQTIEHFQKELGRLRGGRASTSLLETLNVDYYGSTVPLQQLGMVNAPEPRLLTIQVYDAGAIESIEKAIMQANLGLNPARDGNTIRVSIPALTEERRKDLVKTLHKTAEESRVSVRGHRRDAIDALKKAQKDKEISEDDLHRAQDEVQKITDALVKEVDGHLESKEKEMLEV